MISFSPHCGANERPALRSRGRGQALLDRGACRRARRGSRLEGLGRLHLRQEPEPSDLHAQHRAVELGGRVRPPQERPVAADRHDQVGRAVSSASRASDDLDAVVPQGGAERRRRVDSGRPPLVHDESRPRSSRTDPLLPRSPRRGRRVHHPPRGGRAAGTRRCRPDRGAARRSTPSTPTAAARNASITSVEDPSARRRDRGRLPRCPRPPAPPRTAASPARRTRRRGCATATSAGIAARSEMNDRSATTRSARTAGRGCEVRTLVRSITVTRGSLRSSHASWPYPTSTADDPGRARLQQAVGEPAGGRARVEAVAVAGIDVEPIEGRARASLPRARRSERAGPITCTGASSATSDGGLRRRAPGDGHPPRGHRGLRFRPTARQPPAHELDVEPPTGHGADP